MAKFKMTPQQEKELAELDELDKLDEEDAQLSKRAARSANVDAAMANDKDRKLSLQDKPTLEQDFTAAKEGVSEAAAGGFGGQAPFMGAQSSIQHQVQELSDDGIPGLPKFLGRQALAALPVAATTMLGPLGIPLMPRAWAAGQRAIKPEAFDEAASEQQSKYDDAMTASPGVGQTAEFLGGATQLARGGPALSTIANRVSNVGKAAYKAAPNFIKGPLDAMRGIKSPAEVGAVVSNGRPPPVPRDIPEMTSRPSRIPDVNPDDVFANRNEFNVQNKLSSLDDADPSAVFRNTPEASSAPPFNMEDMSRPPSMLPEQTKPGIRPEGPWASSDTGRIRQVNSAADQMIGEGPTRVNFKDTQQQRVPGMLEAEGMANTPGTAIVNGPPPMPSERGTQGARPSNASGERTSAEFPMDEAMRERQEGIPFEEFQRRGQEAPDFASPVNERVQGWRRQADEGQSPSQRVDLQESAEWLDSMINANKGDEAQKMLIERFGESYAERILAELMQMKDTGL